MNPLVTTDHNMNFKVFLHNYHTDTVKENGKRNLNPIPVFYQTSKGNSLDTWEFLWPKNDINIRGLYQ